MCFLGSIATLAAIAGLGSLQAAWSIGALFNLAGLTLFAMVAGRFFMDARHTGELELLLVTPVGARGVLREHRMALHRLLLGPTYLVTFGAFLVAVAGFQLDSNKPRHGILSDGIAVGGGINLTQKVNLQLYYQELMKYYAVVTVGL